MAAGLETLAQGQVRVEVAEGALRGEENTAQDSIRS